MVFHVYPGLACLPWDTGTCGWPMVQDSLRVLGSQAGSSCSVSCCTASPQDVGKAGSQPWSAETGTPCSFSCSTLSQISLTVCRWPSASGCTTCCSKRQSPVCNWKWPKCHNSAALSTGMLGLGEMMSLHLGALAAVSVHEVVGDVLRQIAQVQGCSVWRLDLDSLI